MGWWPVVRGLSAFSVCLLMMHSSGSSAAFAHVLIVVALRCVSSLLISTYVDTFFLGKVVSARPSGIPKKEPPFQGRD